MSAKYNSGVHRFAVFIVAWTVLLFVFGALVTSKNAALSVPDWPKSFGTWFPSLRQLVGGAFFEHSHRVIAGVMGILTLMLAVLIWVRDPRRWLRWFGVIAVAGVVVQAMLGGEVVRQLLQYWLPVLHACFAQLCLRRCLGIAVFTSKWWIDERPQLEDRRCAVHSYTRDSECSGHLLSGFPRCGFPALGNSRSGRTWLGRWQCLATVIWTAVALRKRFDDSPEMTARSRFAARDLWLCSSCWALARIGRGWPLRKRRGRSGDGCADGDAHGGWRAIVCAFDSCGTDLLPSGASGRGSARRHSVRSRPNEHRAHHGTDALIACGRVCRANQA